MNKQNDVDTFFTLLEFGAGCFILGAFVGIVFTVLVGVF